MSQQIIDIGAAPNDNLGDPIRTAFGFTNDNFTQLFANPNPAPPATLIGKNGDVPGMYAYSPSFFYYCFGTYDGTSIIWAQLSSSASSSGSYIANGASSVYVYYNDAVTITIAGAANVATFTTEGVTLPGNVNATNLSATGYVYGNGAFLTGITATGTNYSNANVAAYLPTYSGNIGNIAVSSLTTPNTISAAGNITTSGYFIGTFLGNVVGNLVVPGSNTQVLYNNNGNAGASTALTFDTNGNVLTVFGNIRAQSNIAAANINSGNVSAIGIIQGGSFVSNGSASISNGIYAGNSITSNGYISAQGNIYANYFFGNFIANTTYSNVAVTVSGNAQPNIRSVSNTLTIGNVSIDGVGNVINVNTVNTSIVNANSIIANTVTGTLTTNAQPNITSVGTLTSINIAGAITGNSDMSIAGNITTNGYVSAAGNIISNSSVLVNNDVSTAGNVLISGYMSATGNAYANNLFISNDVSIGNTVNVGGDVSMVGSLSTLNNISALGSIAAQGIISATGDIITRGLFVGNFQGNIVGNIVGAPGANTDILFNTNGNVDAVPGLTFSKGPNTLAVLGPITAQGDISTPANVNGASVSAIGLLQGDSLNITNTATANWFRGTLFAPGVDTQLLINQNGNVGATPGLNYTTSPTNLLSVTGNIQATDTVTSTFFAGDIRGNVLTANQPFISSLANIVYIGAAGNGILHVGNIAATFLAGKITNSNQNNITNVGTLINLSVNGNTVSGQFVGNGVSITNINGANVSNVVPLATTAQFAGTVTTNAQPNITSVGTLLSLSISGDLGVNGNTTLANLSAANVTFANISSSGNILTSGNVSAAGDILTAGNVSAGGNISTSGWLSATGNITTPSNVSIGVNASVGGNILTSGLVSATGDIKTFGNANITLNTNINGNTSIVGYASVGGNILTSGLVSATGSILSASNISAAGNVSVGGNVSAGGNIITPSNVSVGGNVSAGGNVRAGGNVLAVGYVSAGGNILTPFNASVGGNVSAGGNIIAFGFASINGNIVTPLNVNAGSDVNAGGKVSATGNVYGANLNTTGLMSAGGQVIGSGFTAPPGFFLLPRYTSAQIAGLAGMVGGELVYNTDLNLIQGYQMDPVTSTMTWTSWTVAVYQ